MNETALPPMLRDMVRREVEPSERIQWVDMPKPAFFTPGATAAFLFAVPWTAFAVFWIAGASGFKIPEFHRGEDLFPLFGLPFVLIGLAMLSAPLWAYRKSLKTAYVITDRRAILFEGGRKTTIRSYEPEQLTEIYRKEKADGSGDVIIETIRSTNSNGGNHTVEHGFLRVADAKGVERRLKDLAARDR